MAEFGKMKDYLWDINFDVKLQICATMRMTPYCLLLPLYALSGVDSTPTRIHVPIMHARAHCVNNHILSIRSLKLDT